LGGLRSVTMVEVSKFGSKIARTSGIGQLMDDLGSALAKGGDVIMLGGGNPAHIREVQRQCRQSLRRLLDNEADFASAVGDYDPPAGNREFIEAVCELLREEFGWDIGTENIALTNGSQSAFFILFNLFGGVFERGVKKKILLPLTPEYIGYSDVGLADELFVAIRPGIQHLDDHIFKYNVDFDRIDIGEEIGAICVSRPTNPTGNVLTDSEIKQLDEMARLRDIPLIIDSAYGMPFPNIIFTQAKPVWNSNTVLCMSLSKLGLPAVRTGIVVADKEVINMMAQANAVMSLAPGGMGPAIATELVRSREILRLSRDVIKPFYQAKATAAVAQLTAQLDGLDFHIHKPEGAFFLWLWLEKLPITSAELYERLKARGVIVVPGHYFFPGLCEDWKHKDQCIRINYAQDDKIVKAGLSVIAEEIRRVYTRSK